MEVRRSHQLLLALLVLLPNAGCLGSWSKLPDFTRALDSPAAGGKKQETLPPHQSAALCLSVAENLHRSGHRREAAMGYETARQYNPSLKHLAARLAVLYDELGIMDKAQEEYKKALHYEPRNANLLNNFGRFYYNQGKWAEAEKYYREALEHDAENKWAWNNLGSVLAQQDRYEDSLAAYKHVNSEAVAYQSLAFHLMSQGKHEQARHSYEKALQLNPNLPLAREALKKYDEEKQETAQAKTAAPALSTRQPLLRTSVEAANSLPEMTPVAVPDLGSRRKAVR